VKTIDIFPDYQNMSDEELIEKIPSNTILPISNAVAEFYDSKVSMCDIYSYYGMELQESDSQQQVQCLLPQHGSQDRHPSARFYPVDRNTGEIKHAIYCHKCMKTVSPFWLLYSRESTYSGIHMRGLYLFIKRIFKVPFPRHIFFNFDPQEYYVLTESEAYSKIQKMQYAQTLLQLKNAKDPLYISEMKRFWQEM